MEYDIPEDGISFEPGPRPNYGPARSAHAELALQHWQEFLPRKYAELVRTGKLEEALSEVSMKMKTLTVRYVLQGYGHGEALLLAAQAAYLFAPEANHD